MKKRNVIIIIAIVVFILILSILIVVSKYKKEDKITYISLEQLDKKIETTEEFDFSKMQVLDIEKTSATIFIDSSKINNVIGRVPIINTKSSMYIVIQADKENIQEIKLALESYATEYEEQWRTYLPDQYELAKNRKIGIYDNYVYMIVSENPDKIVELIM